MYMYTCRMGALSADITEPTDGEWNKAYKTTMC